MSAVVPKYDNVTPMLSRYASNLECSWHRLGETPEPRSKVKLVLLLIGANDMAMLKAHEGKAAERIQERFISGYTSLLSLVREHRPAVPIVSLLGDAGSMSACQLDEKEWYNEKLTKFIHEAHNLFGNDELCFVHA
eukprot:6483516-Amphidinium_carterae.1